MLDSDPYKVLQLSIELLLKSMCDAKRDEVLFLLKGWFNSEKSKEKYTPLMQQLTKIKSDVAMDDVLDAESVISVEVKDDGAVGSGVMVGEPTDEKPLLCYKPVCESVLFHSVDERREDVEEMDMSKES